MSDDRENRREALRRRAQVVAAARRDYKMKVGHESGHDIGDIARRHMIDMLDEQIAISRELGADTTALEKERESYIGGK